jgi:hypothetical protein
MVKCPNLDDVVAGATDRASYEAALAKPEFAAAWRFEQDLVRSLRWKWFAILRAYCCVCSKKRVFVIWRRSINRDGAADSSNLRNSVACCACRQRSRQRKVFELLRDYSVAGQRIYMTEQNSALFGFVRTRLAGRDVVGSEYLGSALASGQEINGLRHEDLQRLSFPDGTVDIVCSCDVLEHVPHPARALNEIQRVLAPKGVLLLTVPFHSAHSSNVVRAHLGEAGAVVHTLPPAYHHDPIRRQGSLVFTDFGWELMDMMAQSGFTVTIHLYWSLQSGYLGIPSQVFVCRKGLRKPTASEP